MPPIPTLPVSGRYRGRRGDSEVELRIDVDGSRPMHRLSADYFHGEAREYVGSMVVDQPHVVRTPSLMTIAGVARSTWDTDVDRVTATIPTTGGGPTTLLHSTPGGRVEARYECAYESPAFRQVRIEEDVELGVTRFDRYDTGTLGAPCEARTLTLIDAFRDAGIEMVRPREPNVVQGTGASWSDAELHAAMEQHFAALADAPRWAVWLLHARLHDNDSAGRGYLGGLMFDQRGRERQGCAVFYEGLRGKQSERARLELFTCVHEVAHSFNLLHSFEKSRAIPPVPSRPGSATWLAYPDLFPEGADAFWSRFGFEFDDAELVHLRHAMRDDVIMGGSPFTAGAAFEQNAAEVEARIEDPGVRLELRCPPTVPFGVPVTVELALWGTAPEGRAVPSIMGPRVGNVDISITRGAGEPVVFEPLLRHCRVNNTDRLRAGDPPVRDSAFIHYGKDGFMFASPGRYRIRATCTMPQDGAVVLSNVVHLRVPEPVTRADRAVAELVFGDEQGALMSLVGSDAPQLRGGDDALRSIVERHPRHDVASIARIVRATNEARDFKQVRLDGSVHLRPSHAEDLASILRGTPGVHDLQRVAAQTAGRARRQALAQTLASAPVDAVTQRVVDPFVRSRLDEILIVAPQALALIPAPVSSEVLVTTVLSPPPPPPLD